MAAGKTVVIALYALTLALGLLYAVRVTQQLAARIQAVPTLEERLAVGGTAQEPGPAGWGRGGVS